MPPPEAVKEGKVPPLSDEDRRVIVRWIDLGCPIDLDYDPADPSRRGYGWMCDDNRPVLALAEPKASVSGPVSRVLIGMHDYYSGLDMASFTVIADFPLAGHAAGANLAPHFQLLTKGVWELKLPQPLPRVAGGNLVVSVKDRQGNIARIDRRLSATPHEN
jgi:hypothetical protein